jgi:hypothetical protein
MATDVTAPSSFLEAWQAFLDIARERAIEVIGQDVVSAGCEQLLMNASGRVLVATDFRATLPQPV